MRLPLAVGLAALLGGCITVTTTVGPGAEPGPERAAPIASGPQVIDELWVDADAEQGQTGSAVLDAGREYLVTVEGTFSVWRAGQWRSVCAGDPDARPVFQSGGRTGFAGLDAAYAFAVPRGSSLCERPSPTPNAGWRYRLRPGDSWTFGPLGAPYAADHRYTYRLIGKGAPLQVAVRDVPGQYADNYGRLRVTVTRVAAGGPDGAEPVW